ESGCGRILRWHSEPENYGGRAAAPLPAKPRSPGDQTALALNLDQGILQAERAEHWTRWATGAQPHVRSLTGHFQGPETECCPGPHRTGRRTFLRPPLCRQQIAHLRPGHYSLSADLDPLGA